MPRMYGVIFALSLSFYGLVAEGSKCSEAQYQCFDGSCISIDSFCDSNQDCRDNSDEYQCYSECIHKDDPRGSNYRGRRNITHENVPCQHWSSQYPNKHGNSFLSSEENYCRVGIQLDDVLPFCYANVTTIRWQVCDIPICDFKSFNCTFDDDMCGWLTDRKDKTTWHRTRMQDIPDHTNGNTQFLTTEVSFGDDARLTSPFVNLTIIPKCISFWFRHVRGEGALLNVYAVTDDRRHLLENISIGSNISEWSRSENYIDYQEIFRIELVAGSNGRSGPSALAVDDIQIVNEICPGMTCTSTEYQCNDGTCINMHYFCDFYPDCQDGSDETNCQTECLLPSDARGSKYRGSRATTANGQSCFSWKSKYEVYHNFTDMKEEGAFCRNPDNRKAPWCFTDPLSDAWEFCGIQSCGRECVDNGDHLGFKYRGTLNKTKCGIPCQRWDSKVPHKHSMALNSEENYCRNPGDFKQVWCYTIDPQKRWDTCPVLQNCVPEMCTEDEWVCGSGQCIPNVSVQNGLLDCFDLSDEISDNCTEDGTPRVGLKENPFKTYSSYGCPNGYKCRDANLARLLPSYSLSGIINGECISRERLCDGYADCLLRDDESGCYGKPCPDDCFCNGLSAQCSFSSDTLELLPVRLRSLDLSSSIVHLRELLKFSFPLLIHLNLSNTSIDHIVINQTIAIGLGCENIQTLDLRHNFINVIPTRSFQRMFRLHKLYIEGNPIASIENEAFIDLFNVRDLAITDAAIEVIRVRAFAGLKNLVHLNLSNNSILDIEDNAFDDNSMLEVLILNHNKIQTISNEFLATTRLRLLDLSFNRISIIEESSFGALKYLEELNLQGNHLKHISYGHLSNLLSVRKLNMSLNNIQVIKQGAFIDLSKLSFLDLRNNDISIYRDLFRGLVNLKRLYVDSYTLCCVKPDSVDPKMCFSPQDKISSCLFLIKQGFLGIGIWFLALMAIIGNLCVLIYRLNFEQWKKIHTYTVFVINLTVSDLLMGIYLFIIAYKDNEYRGSYFVYDNVWRNSAMCSFAGILATVSSESSAMLILFITMDRVLGIKFTFSSFRFTKRSAMVWSIVVWCLTILLAVFPTIYYDSFKGNFYSASGVCISLPLSTNFEYGHWYSFSVFIVLNFAIFCGICIGQLVIFREIRGVISKVVKRSTVQSSEASAARSLFAVVMTDILCWLPIAIMGLMAVAGVEIPVDMYAWLIVLVLPVNSAINPYLYTLSSVRMQRRQSVKENYYSRRTSVTKTVSEYDDSTKF